MSDTVRTTTGVLLDLTTLMPTLRTALAEDIGSGDVTTRATVPEDLQLSGRIVAKQPGIIAGLAVARHVFALLDSSTRLNAKLRDGDPVEAGTVVAEVTGPGRAILSGERVALNLMQRMSGIATLTRQYVEQVAGTRASILDTRKTVPGLRLLDKWAVRLGGGHNHRTGLYDMALVKENHIAAAGGDMARAVEQVRAATKPGFPVEVEVRTLDELRQALELPVDRIMLDNMTLGQLREAVQIATGRTSLEASGNVSLDNVAEIAATGVDCISVGALTHSVSALDISLLID